jgi:hypothetical protein
MKTTLHRVDRAAPFPQAEPNDNDMKGVPPSPLTEGLGRWIGGRDWQAPLIE